MAWLPFALLVLGAYLLGSVPFALLLGLTRGVDIRAVGSGNIGATNLARALGRSWATAAFLLDYSKGLLPVACLQLFPVATPLPRFFVALACGAAAIFGHVFPIFLRFRGGKGVATTFGVMTALAWQATLAAAAIWVALYLATRVVSLASLAAALCFPAGVWLSQRLWPPDDDAEALELQLFSLAVAVVILVRHRANIVRLARGEEFSFSKPIPKRCLENSGENDEKDR